jgi:diguanylate cyclase (GGDEF)-like protein
MVYPLGYPLVQPVGSRGEARLNFGRVATNTDEETRLKRERLARAEELRLLFRQSFPAVFASLLVGLLVVIALWPVQDHGLLTGWYALLGFSSLARIAVFLGYRRALPEGEAILEWERPYRVTLLLSGTIWGLGALLIMPVDSFLHQVVLLFFLVGMSGGALGVYSPHRSLMLATISVMLLPSAFWLLYQGTTLALVMTVGIVAFMITVIRSSEVLSSRLHQSFLLALVLDGARNEAERMARVDELTGVANRRAFYEEGRALQEWCEHNEELLAMILVDVDHFKRINDDHGHANGDRVLKKVAEILRQAMRSSDVCARIGGEEFGILMPVSRVEDAVKLAQKLCRRLATAAIPLQGEGGEKRASVTASFGVTTGCASLEALFRAADGALYQAKARGRNQVVYAACTG